MVGGIQHPANFIGAESEEIPANGNVKLRHVHMLPFTSFTVRPQELEASGAEGRR